jgi:hypothetical protein
MIVGGYFTVRKVFSYFKNPYYNMSIDMQNNKDDQNSNLI